MTMPTGTRRDDLYTGEKAERIIALYLSGLNLAQVASECGAHLSTIRRVLAFRDVPRRPSGMVGRRHTEAAKRAVGDANRSRKVGDRTLSTDGYVLIYQPEHPHANNVGCVKEHRLVMETLLGRYLSPDEVVHHKNGVKDDNDPTNLELFASNSDHSKHHMPVGHTWHRRGDPS